MRSLDDNFSSSARSLASVRDRWGPYASCKEDRNDEPLFPQVFGDDGARIVELATLDGSERRKLSSPRFAVKGGESWGMSF